MYVLQYQNTKYTGIFSTTELPYAYVLEIECCVEETQLEKRSVHGYESSLDESLNRFGLKQVLRKTLSLRKTRGLRDGILRRRKEVFSRLP